MSAGKGGQIVVLKSIFTLLLLAEFLAEASHGGNAKISSLEECNSCDKD